MKNFIAELFYPELYQILYIYKVLEITKPRSLMTSEFCWQGRQGSNLQSTVLETATIPLGHSPVLPLYFTIGKSLCQWVTLVNSQKISYILNFIWKFYNFMILYKKYRKQH
jgi:hypothetical protein